LTQSYNSKRSHSTHGIPFPSNNKVGGSKTIDEASLDKNHNKDLKSAIKQLNEKFNDLEIRYDHLETNYSKDQSKDKYKQNVKSNNSNN